MTRAAAGRAAPARWPLLRAEEMRSLEAQCAEQGVATLAELMERAGEAVAQQALALLAEHSGAVLVACGPGHNGGDGLVAARLLHARRVPVTLWPLRAPGEFRGLAAEAWRRAQQAGVPVLPPDAQPAPAALVIDALFGTGTRASHRARETDAALSAHIAHIGAQRNAGARVLAVDLPTGVLADTGQFTHAPVRATHTLALGQPKLGHALEPGRAACGRIRVARLGMPALAAMLRPARLLDLSRAPHALPPRPAHWHKRRAGHLLVVAGSVGKTGAAALVARGALRAGAGLVTLACRASLCDILEVKCTEAMTLPLPERRGGALHVAGALRQLENFAGADAWVLGPGLGRDAQAARFVRAFVEARRGARIVLDADALHAFARAPEQLARAASEIILTPHPGEAAALLGVATQAVNDDRASAARELAERTRCCVVLKGAGTVIASPADARGEAPTLHVNPTGNPLLATGGSGDVLAGLLGALLAARADTFAFEDNATRDARLPAAQRHDATDTHSPALISQPAAQPRDASSARTPTHVSQLDAQPRDASRTHPNARASETASPALTTAQAAELGVWLHGAVADELARRTGWTAGALASEIADEIPATLQAARAQAAATPRARSSYGTPDVVDFP